MSEQSDSNPIQQTRNPEIQAFMNRKENPFLLIQKKIISLLFWILDTIRFLGTNPIVLHEFVRTLRRGRLFFLLFIVLAVCMSIVCMLWEMADSPLNPVGRTLYFWMLGGQIIVISLMLPGLVAQSIITERERDTLPLLLSTPLGPSRILMGKLISTLGYAALLIVSTLPIISVCVARGGVSPTELVLGPLFVLYLALIIACTAIYHALSAKNINRATVSTLFTVAMVFSVSAAAFVFAGAVIAGTMAFLFHVWGKTPNISPETVFKITAAFYFLSGLVVPFWLFYSSHKKLNELESKTRYSWEMIRPSTFRYRLSPSGKKKSIVQGSYWRYQDGQNPFYIRERLGYIASLPPFSVPSWYIVIIFSHFLFPLAVIQEGRWVAILVLLGIAQLGPVFSADLFAGERENKTWDLLQTTACTLRSLVFGKCMGALYQCGIRSIALFFPPFLLGFLLLAFITVVSRQNFSLFPAVHIPFFLSILLTQTLFLVMLGAFFSARAPRVNQSLGATYVFALVYFIVPLILHAYQYRGKPFLGEGWTNLLSPLYLLVSIPQEIEAFFSENWLFYAIGHILIFLSGSALLFVFTCRKLKKTSD